MPASPDRSGPSSDDALLDRLCELDDRWLVPMLGTVTQCRLDYAFSVIVVVEPTTRTFEVRIEQPFVVYHDGEESTLDPEGDPVHLAPALHVLRTTVKQAIAFKSGGLELMFDNGLMLRVPEDENGRHHRRRQDRRGREDRHLYRERGAWPERRAGIT